jgi:hypothetical protein
MRTHQNPHYINSKTNQQTQGNKPNYVVKIEWLKYGHMSHDEERKNQCNYEFHVTYYKKRKFFIYRHLNGYLLSHILKRIFFNNWVLEHCILVAYQRK